MDAELRKTVEETSVRVAKSYRIPVEDSPYHPQPDSIMGGIITGIRAAGERCIKLVRALPAKNFDTIEDAKQADRIVSEIVETISDATGDDVLGIARYLPSGQLKTEPDEPLFAILRNGQPKFNVSRSEAEEIVLKHYRESEKHHG